MVETHWEDISGMEVRYHDHTWELTGDVDVLEDGALLAVEAKQSDDVRGQTGRLHFDLETSTGSLNPGDLGDQFDRLERTDDGQYLVVRKDRQTYRYVLRRLEYE
jgi:hypothetical protein